MLKLIPKRFLRRVLVQYATETTTFYREASAIDLYHRQSEKAWVATVKWLLYKTKVVK
jgi:hypothetical protein